MADSSTPEPPAPETPDDAVLDLRDLAQQHQPVLTSAGTLHMRKLGALGPLERVRVTMLYERSTRLAERVAKLEPGDSEGPTTLEQMANQLVDEENQLLGLIVPGITDEQLFSLPAPERAGLLAAFFGASPERARAAVQATARLLAPLAAPTPRARRTGESKRRASNASTAATPSGG